MAWICKVSLGASGVRTSSLLRGERVPPSGGRLIQSDIRLACFPPPDGSKAFEARLVAADGRIGHVAAIHADLRPAPLFSAPSAFCSIGAHGRLLTGGGSCGQISFLGGAWRP